MRYSSILSALMLLFPCSLNTASAADVNLQRLAKVKSIALLAIKDPRVIQITTKAATQRQAAGILCGPLCELAVNASQEEAVSTKELLWGSTDGLRDAHNALNRKAIGLGETVTNSLLSMMREDGYEMSRSVERAVAKSNPFDFYKGQNSKSDAILHVVINHASYLDEDDKYLRHYIQATVTLADSKYGSTLFKGDYSCPNTSKNEAFSFANLKQVNNDIDRASKGLIACMTEIATEVAVTLKRPSNVPDPARPEALVVLPAQ